MQIFAEDSTLNFMVKERGRDFSSIAFQIVVLAYGLLDAKAVARGGLEGGTARAKKLSSKSSKAAKTR